MYWFWELQKGFRFFSFHVFGLPKAWSRFRFKINPIPRKMQHEAASPSQYEETVPFWASFFFHPNTYRSQYIPFPIH
jgi:hypothetical protein